MVHGISEWLNQNIFPKALQGKSRQTRFIKAIIVTHFLLLSFWGYELYNTTKTDSSYYRPFFETTRMIGFDVREYENALLKMGIDSGDQKTFLMLKQEIQNSMTGLSASISHSALKDDEFVKVYQEFENKINSRLKIAEQLQSSQDQLQNSMASFSDLGKSLNQILAQSLPASTIDDMMSKNLLSKETLVQVNEIMVLLEEQRFIAQLQDRSNIFEKIMDLREKIPSFSEDLQGKLYLFSDKAKDIAQKFRDINLIYSNMASDNIKQDMDFLYQSVKKKQSDYNSQSETNFNFLLLLGMLLVASEAIIGVWLLKRLQFVNVVEKQLRAETEKNKQVFAKARQYSQEAHRTQFDLLSGFCRDFQYMLHLMNNLSQKLHTQLKGTSAQHAGDELLEVDMALQSWINNYIDIHQSDDNWPTVNNQGIVEVKSLMEKIFLSVRYYGGGVGDKTALYIDNTVPESVKFDQRYVQTIMQNALLIVLKWTDARGLRMSVSRSEGIPFKSVSEQTQVDKENMEESSQGHKSEASGKSSENKMQDMIQITFFDSGENVSFDKRKTYFQSINGDSISWDGMDKFIVVALDVCQRMLERLGGSFGLFQEKDMVGLRINIPYIAMEKMESSDKSAQEEADISFETSESPILGKRVLIISPYEHVRVGLSAQLQAFDAIAETISDRFAAIGQILDRMDKSPYDCIIVDHCPAFVNAVDLLLKIRSVVTHENVALVVMVAEEDLETVSQQAKGLVHGILIKPTVPSKLEAQLNHLFSNPLSLERKDFFNPEEEMVADGEGSPSVSVMVYEPDDLQQILIQTSLVEKGFQVTCFKDENQAVSSALSTCYQLIFFSDKLKDHNAVQFASKLRSSQGQCPTAGIILLATSEYLPEQLTAAEIDDNIVSPVYQKTLVQKAEEWRDPTMRRLSNDGMPVMQQSVA